MCKSWRREIHDRYRRIMCFEPTSEYAPWLRYKSLFDLALFFFSFSFFWATAPRTITNKKFSTSPTLFLKNCAIIFLQILTTRSQKQIHGYRLGSENGKKRDNNPSDLLHPLSRALKRRKTIFPFSRAIHEFSRSSHALDFPFVLSFA